MRCCTRVPAWSWMAVLLGLSWSVAPVAQALATEVVIYGFEHGEDGWAIPDWAKASNDYVGAGLAVSHDHAVEGRASLEMQAQFPGGRWTGAYVERLIETTDWSAFGDLLLSVYLPLEAPHDLKGKVILTVGDQWTWTEASRAVPLEPGQWTTLSVNLKPGSMDWKFFPDDAFRRDVRKLGIRIESDKGSAYSGPIFIDDVRLSG